MAPRPSPASSPTWGRAGRRVPWVWSGTGPRTPSTTTMPTGASSTLTAPTPPPFRRPSPKRRRGTTSSTRATSPRGLTGSANRNLIDYFQVSFDPTGAAVIAYTDDHNDFDGHTYVTRQIGG